MTAALRGLAANLAAGLRLALFLPVARTAFRIDAAQLLLLAVASALFDLAADRLRFGPGLALDPAAAGTELASLAVLVLAAAALAWAFRDDPLVLALPVVVLASLPIVQIASVVPTLLAADDERPAWIADAVHYALLGWFLLLLARSAYVALSPHRLRWARAVAGAALLAVPLLLPTGVLPEARWWAADADLREMDPGNPAAEPILSLQRELQDDALADLRDHAEGETDLYFVAFAPDGNGGVWSERLDAAQRMMDGHWRTEGRSLVYVNDASKLTQTPMATITHLREALDEIAAAADPDEDVVMLFLAGRSNADGSMVVSLPPLGLVQLSGAGLASLFEQAGIRWRIVVLATCAPQSFVDALADAQTLVMAATGDGAQAAGCARGGEPTPFADALFDALATTSTIPAAFAEAQRRLSAEGPPPVMHLGGEIAARLGRLRGAAGGRAALTGVPRS